MTKPRFRSVLLDTNIWLDNYIGSRKGNAAAGEVFRCAAENDLIIYYAPTSLKDVYCLVGSFLKADARNRGEAITEDRARAMQEIAWGCAHNMSWLGICAPIGESQVRTAMRYRGLHPDLEDDLLLACLEVEGVDSFVTNDKSLLGKAPVPSFTPETFVQFASQWH